MDEAGHVERFSLGKYRKFYGQIPARLLQVINKITSVMNNETPVVVAEYNSETEAEVARTLLEDAGVGSMIRNEYMSTLYPVGAMPAQLVVSSEEAEKAREILFGRKRKR